jgi:hypothetical protein
MAEGSGCVYVVGHMVRWNAALKRNERVATHCGKIPDTGSPYCPKHKLMVAHEVGKAQRKPESYY